MNKQEKYQARLRAVGITSEPQASGGVFHFERISAESLRQLIETDLVDPQDAQNDSPTVGEISQFLDKYPKFYGHGYIVVPSREDERISLEGVASDEELSQDEFQAFVEMFRLADEFSVDEHGARAWYD